MPIVLHIFIWSHTCSSQKTRQAVWVPGLRVVCPSRLETCWGLGAYDSSVYCTTNRDVSLDITNQWLKMAAHSVVLHQTGAHTRVVLVKVCPDSNKRLQQCVTWTIWIVHLTRSLCLIMDLGGLPAPAGLVLALAALPEGRKHVPEMLRRGSQLVLLEPCFSFSALRSSTLAAKHFPQKTPQIKPFSSQSPPWHPLVHSPSRNAKWSIHCWCDPSQIGTAILVQSLLLT